MKLRLTIILLMTLLVSCIAHTAEPTIEVAETVIRPTSQGTSPESNGLETPTIAPTITSTPTEKPTNEPATPHQSPTSTPNPDARLRFSCINVNSDSDTQISDGLLIVEKPDTLQAYMLDMSTGITLPLSGYPIYGAVRSPDLNRLAYATVGETTNEGNSRGNIIIVTSDGVAEQSIPWNLDWSEPLGWSDNENLILRILDSEVSNGLYKYIRLNILDKSYQLISPDLPNISDAYPPPNWEGWGSTMYNPALTQVVYYAKSLDGDVYTLWDLVQSQAIASFPIIRYPIPLWSPDGSQFLITNWYQNGSVNADLLSIGLNGSIQQLTFLSKYYPVLEILNYNWSPSGRYIALWINTFSYSVSDKEKGANLVILDIQNGIVTDFCLWIQSGGTGFGPTYPPAAVWSPNSNQLVVFEWYHRDKSRTILVDVEKMVATVIGENIVPLNWLASSP